MQDVSKRKTDKLDFFSFLHKHETAQRVMLTIKHTPVCVPAIIFFTILFAPFVGLIPYLDGETEFLIAVNFYQGKYLTNWMPYHPPIKLFLAAILFKLFGFFSYSVLGYSFGVLGIITLYLITEKLYNKKAATISAVLLSLSGIYISSALFSLNDFLLTVFILLSFMWYVKERYLYASIFACFAVMSKESAIIFPITIIIVELFQKKFRTVNILPFVTLGIWVVFLHFTGHALWNSWNFSSSVDAGSFFTVINNIISGGIFNKFAYENWLHLFIFNFNWVLWLFALCAFIKMRWTKYIAIIVFFTFLYSLTILSFQTYSITRYILPLLPFLYLFVGVILTKVKYQFIFIPVVFGFVLISLFTSSDPISDRIWPKWQVLKTDSFYLDRTLDGNDGITYNMQFLYLTKERTNLIKTGDCAQYIADLNIYPQTLKALQIPQCH